MGNYRGAVATEMDNDIVVKEFEFQLRYYVHFRANALGGRYQSPNLLSYGLNSTTTVLQGWFRHQITHKGQYASRIKKAKRKFLEQFNYSKMESYISDAIHFI